MLPPVQSDNVRQLGSCDVLRIDSFYFLLIDIVKGCLRGVGPGQPRPQKQWTLASALWNRDDHGAHPLIFGLPASGPMARIRVLRLTKRWSGK